MATKKDQANEESTQEPQISNWMFPNLGDERLIGAEPYIAQGVTLEEAEKRNHEYLEGLRNIHKKETN